MRWTGENDPILTPFIRSQLAMFVALAVLGLGAVVFHFVRVPAQVGIGQYTLYVDLPRSGGLYATGHVVYRGATIGQVKKVEPTEQGARATISVANRYKIPLDASANVHSVSAVGEQYLDIVSESGDTSQHFREGQTITNSTVPSEVGPALDALNNALAAIPNDKIDDLLVETSQAVGGLGPALQRLVDSTTAIASDFRDNLNPVNDIIAHTAPILDSQVNSADAIEAWAANLNVIGAQAAEQDAALRSGLQQAAPTADQLNAVFSGVQDSLPQTLANLEIVIDMLKRYHKGVEQAFVYFPESAAQLQAGAVFPGYGIIDFALLTNLNQPPPCLTGFLPPSEWRAPADTSQAPLPSGLYCKIPKDYQGLAVRGARNYPCVDVPGKRAASPRECRSNEPYVPLGTNPWWGDPNQILTCPAPGARCDQPVEPGRVIPGPSVNNGLNPLPARLLPPTGSPAPVSDPLSPPGQGSVVCSGQQPNPCAYTPSQLPTAIYNPQSGEVVAPDGSRYTVADSAGTGDDGWKAMLAPAG